MPKGIRFVALGSVWLDEIRQEGEPAVRDVVGGSLTFATLGARLFLPTDPKAVGMVLNTGHDFPESVLDVFRSWEVDLLVRRWPDRPSARGIVSYEKGNRNRKGFERLTPPLPITFDTLRDTPLQQARAFEIFCTAEEGAAQILGMQQDEKPSPPCIIIWEPQAKSCLPSTREQHVRTCRYVRVFSPNHEELARFFPEDETVGALFDRKMVERQAAVFLEPSPGVPGIGPAGTGCIVVRAAEHGCLIWTYGREPVWLPPFYNETMSERVVDPTGAGNAFLGAFAIGLQNEDDYVEAARYGTVAASFMLEQVGLPTQSGRGVDETWNGCGVQQRLDQYRRRRRIIG